MCRSLCVLVSLACSMLTSIGVAQTYRSHPPQRPLPTATQRELTTGPKRFVDTTRGDDAADGSLAKPWRTLKHSFRQLQPGDTLYLRGGVYYETSYLSRSGTENAPITIASYPGEMAIIDGGLREFAESPATSWEPYQGGAAGEFVSTKTYFDIEDHQIPRSFLPGAHEPMHGKENERPLVLGNFADSLVPLHGYRLAIDLRAQNEFWTGSKNEMRDEGIYAGPGLWFNRDTGRIHIRLTHHRQPGLGDRAYRGETDPRKLPLVIAAGFGTEVLRISGLQHLRLRDLVFRGATGSPMLSIYGSQQIELDQVTVFGGYPALLVNATQGLKVTNSAFRGLAAPWISRAHMKYRGSASYQLVLHNNQPLNDEIEFAHCEFTDDHDFAFFRYVTNLRFHHNFVDNFNDDGMECGPKLRWHTLFISQNRIGACLIPFSQHEFYKDEAPLDHDPQAGVFAYRNVIDLRAGTYKTPPNEADPSGKYLHEEGHLAGDHGGPLWPVMRFYHNTVLRRTPVFRDSYLFGLGQAGMRHNERDVFNNVFVQSGPLPGVGFIGSTKAENLREGGNVIWGYQADAQQTANHFAKFRASKMFNESKQFYEHGWTTDDLAADPRFARFTGGETTGVDLQLQSDSPAAGAGLPLPPTWPDQLRAQSGKPDSGAVPRGVALWGVGIHGRIPLCGPQ